MGHYKVEKNQEINNLLRRLFFKQHNELGYLHTQ